MEIKMRTPEGKPSKITVDRTDRGVRVQVERNGYVADIHLPTFAARAIASAIEKLLAEEPTQ